MRPCQLLMDSFGILKFDSQWWALMYRWEVHEDVYNIESIFPRENNNKLQLREREIKRIPLNIRILPRWMSQVE
jgi:hypothetical protein